VIRRRLIGIALVLLMTGCTLPTLPWNQPQIEGVVLPAPLGGIADNLAGWQITAEVHEIEDMPHFVICLYNADITELQAIEVQQIAVPGYRSLSGTPARDQEMAQHQQQLDIGGVRQRFPVGVEAPSEPRMVECEFSTPAGQRNVEPQQVVTTPLIELEPGQMILYRASVIDKNGQPAWSGGEIEVRDGRLFSY
jgi:hypothetical protein